VCIALCTIVAHNIAQNRPDSFPPYPPDNHHISDDVYLREGGVDTHQDMLSSIHTTRVHWPVNTSVILDTPCSRAVDTAREDGSWTRVVPNLSLQQGS